MRPIAFMVAALLACGCTSRRYMADARHPEVVVTDRGQLEFCGERIDADGLSAADDPDLLFTAGRVEKRCRRDDRCHSQEKEEEQKISFS